MQNGWIKLHRAFASWEWVDKPEMVSLFINLLINANHEDKNWHGLTVRRGQLIFGLKTWSKKTGISVQSLRSCLARLKSTHEVTLEPTHQHTILTIVNYDKYQGCDNLPTHLPTHLSTHDQHTINTRSTTTKELKKERNKEIIPPYPLPDWIPQQDWNDWAQQRKKKLTPRAAELSVKRLEDLRAKGFSPEVVLQNCILRGWDGIYPPSDFSKSQKQEPYNPWKN